MPMLDPHVTVSGHVEIGSIKRLAIKPGETLVVKVHRRHLTQQEADGVKTSVAPCLPDGVRLLVHAEDMELSVVSAESAE